MATPPLSAKRTRTRTGCWTCRDAGYKCDEVQPKCGRCTRLNIHCKGYGVRLRWREQNPPKRRRSLKGSSESPSESSEHTIQTPAASNSLPRRSRSPSSLSAQPCLSIKPSSMTLDEYRLLCHWTVHISPLLCTSSMSQLNPFQKYLTPIALEEGGALRHIVMSVAANHLTMADPSPKMALAAQSHRVSAIACLREALNNAALRSSDSALATVLVLEISKQFDNAPRHDINHLIGARELILERGGPESLTSPCSRFLLTQLLYRDFLSAVSRGDRPLTDHQWLIKQGDLLNPCLGYDATILRAMARISELKAWKERRPSANDDLGLDLSVAEMEIEGELMSLSVSASGQDQAHTVEAHRSAALIYLYRVVYNIGAPHPLTLFHVRRCLDAIASVGSSSPLVSAHVWPLFTAGCEATEQRDRDFVRQRLADMYHQRKIQSLKKVGELMEEVWINKDVMAVEGAEQMCRVGCIEVITGLGEKFQLV